MEWVDCEEGVYCFDEVSPATAQVTMLGPYNLWHGHLWHPSDKVLSLLSKGLSISNHGTLNGMSYRYDA